MGKHFTSFLYDKEGGIVLLGEHDVFSENVTISNRHF